MKYLGVDYGTKRIGLAVSDESGTLATPLKIIPNKDAVKQICHICENQNIYAIVVGFSINQDGTENKVQEQINEFVAVLTMQTMLPIFFQDETFSSHIAHGSMGKESLHANKTKMKKAENLDAKAAAVILQRYLDKKSK